MRTILNINSGSIYTLPFRIKLAIGYLLLVVLLALFSNWIANDVPIVTKVKDHYIWPTSERSLYLSKQKGSTPKTGFTIVPIVGFYYSSLDPITGIVGPGNISLLDGKNRRHWLGTDTYTRDVLSGIIHGSKIAIWVGLIATIFSSFIGLILGSVAGYFGDRKFILNKYILSISCILIVLYTYLLSWNRVLLHYYKLDIIAWPLLLTMIYLLFKPVEKDQHSIAIPIETIIMKIIAIFQSIPGLFLLTCLISIIGGNITLLKLSLLIALLRWPTFTRIVRGEALKIKNTEYILSARSLGLSNYSIIKNHIWPNLFRQLLVAFAYGVGSAVLLEASLSFLGLGLPPDSVSWGSILSQSRLKIDAWWLAVFPGLMISLLIASCYSIGNYMIKEKVEGFNSTI